MRCCAGASLESLSPRATKCPAKRSSTTQAIIDGSAPRDSLRAFPCVCRQLLRLRTPLRGLRRLRCCWPGVRRRAGRLPRYSGGNEYVAAVLQPHCCASRLAGSGLALLRADRLDRAQLDCDLLGTRSDRPDDVCEALEVA